MKDSLKVAKWEIKTVIHSKVFIIMTFFVPLLILIIGGVIGYISSSGLGSKELTIGLNNQTQTIDDDRFLALNSQNTNIKLYNEEDEEKIMNLINEQKLDSYLVIPSNVLKSNKILSYFTDISGIENDRIFNMINPIIVETRITESGYQLSEINSMVQNIQIESKPLNSKGSSNPIEMFLPFGLAMFMVFASIFSGASLMQSIIKEKSNRIVEILLSSINSWDLMLGKVLGYGVLGCLQILIWSISAVIVLKLFFEISIVSLLTVKIMYMFIFFILGFIIISSINAIVGAGMKEAQSGSQSTGFLVMIPLIPLYFSAIIINNPDGTLSHLFSYIPFTAATTMLVRLGFSSPSILEIAIVIIILIVSNFLLIKLAAKIFRIGMLMYGKNASFKELFRWARSKDF